MDSKKFTEKQIINIFLEKEAGLEIAAISHRHSVSDSTDYYYKANYTGLISCGVKTLSV